MKILFYDPSGSKALTDMVSFLCQNGMKAESSCEMGYEDPEEVSMLLRGGDEQYDVLVCAPDRSEIPNFLARTLRHGGVKIPFIFLTAGDSEQRTSFLEQGASCCLSFPVMPQELMAAVSAQHNLFSHGVAEKNIRIGNVLLDTARKRVSVVREGEGVFPVMLTGKQYFVLEILMRNADRTMSKEQIMDAMYLIDAPELKIIDVFVCKVRKKLEQAGGDPIVQTVWGQGYRAEC